MLPALFGIQALLFHLALANTSLRWHSHASLTSSGGQATCTTGIATVTFTATATHFDLDAFSPLNQYAVTGILQELFEVNSTFVRDRSQGQSTITGPYNIAATLCSASDADLDGTTKTIQMLSHGLGYDRSYWDVGPGYSYVDAAVSRGYAILAYDRLGAGNSDHPDPVNVVQPPIHVEVLHALIQGLKAGSFTGPEYDNVVSVGHSYGSTIQLALTGKYPGDCDAVIPTGVGSNFNYLASALLSNDATIANTVDNRFTELGNGYLITPTVTAYQRPFFRYPYFDPRVLERQLQANGTYSLGDELVSVGVAPAPRYVGPVFVVLGRFDYAFCMGDCSKEGNPAASFASAFYPATSSPNASYIVPDCGHAINQHYIAEKAYAHMLAFLAANDI